MTAKEVDVIVIGAGLSGLTAAYKLRQKDENLDVLVLEAKDCVGGRTVTVKMKSRDGTDSWDLGGQWVGSCQPQIMALLEELGIEVYPQFIRGKKFMQTGKTNRISSYTSDIPTLSLLGKLSLHRVLKLADRMSSEIDPIEPFSCPESAGWDAQTLENFVDAHTWTVDAKDLIRSAMRTMFGAELSQISLLYFLTYIASAGNIKNLLEATTGTGQEFKIKGGAQQICEKLAEKIGSSRIQFGEPVAAIHQTQECITVTSKTNKQFTCRKLIIAIPPSQIGKLSFLPNLPVETREIVKRMAPANIIKFIVTFSECFWRDMDCSGEVVSNGGASTAIGCDSGPVGIVYDGASSSEQPALVGFIGGLQAVQWQKQKEEVRRSAVLKSLADFFGDKVYQYLDYQERIWDLEPYIDGAPVCTVAPGAMKYYASGLRKPFERIHFAGTESATIWCGFMNGAVQAGHRAAIEVLYDLRPQLVSASDIQSVGRQRRLKKKRGRKRKIVKWTMGLGIAVVIAFGIRKFYRSSLLEW